METSGSVTSTVSWSQLCCWVPELGGLWSPCFWLGLGDKRTPGPPAPWLCVSEGSPTGCMGS